MVAENSVVQDSQPTTSQAAQSTFSTNVVANILQTSTEQIGEWQQAFFPVGAPSGSGKSAPPQSDYSQEELAQLIIVQKLIATGKTHEQIRQQIASNQAKKITPSVAVSPLEKQEEVEQAAQAEAPTSAYDLEPSPSVASISPLPNGLPPSKVDQALELQQRPTDAVTPSAMLGEMMSTVANSQQSMLNVQDSIREMLGVIAQDNFNLKHENRKLRERMLELERALSEHQRREETRKERLEGRLRAVENTLGAIQQQITQLVQLQRRKERRTWFR